MSGGILFGAGIPTEPDVTSLINMFGVPTEDTPIAYESVAAVIGVAVTSHRFRTVTCAWRRELETTSGVILRARDGQFSVRAPVERLALSKQKATSGVRAFRRAGTVITGTDRARLTETERSEADKVMRVVSVAEAAALSEARRKRPPRLEAVN